VVKLESQRRTKAAEQDAQAALAIVPNWHYVRDILMHQIRDAKARTEPVSRFMMPGDSAYPVEGLNEIQRAMPIVDWICCAL
jgi:hypothetical protein